MSIIRYAVPTQDAVPHVRWGHVAAYSGSAMLILALGFFVAALLARPPEIIGDGVEYAYMIESWYNHGTPDLRPQDQPGRAAFIGPVEFHREDGALVGYYQARTGAWYSYHFWFYSFSAVPAFALLRALGHDVSRAMFLTNALWFAVALIIVARTTALPIGRRWAFGALAALSPVLWYIGWTGPEVQSWAGVTIALAMVSQRRYPAAGLAAALAAWQNPPLLPLVGAIALLALLTHQRRTAILTGGFAVAALLPSAFTMALYGTPNLIAKVGMADPRLASPGRTWSMLADFNQGLLPYVPLLLVLALVAVGRAASLRAHAALVIAAAFPAILILAESTANWNSGALGMMRYLVWMVPILAWLAATQLPAHGWGRTMVVLAAVLHLAITLAPGMHGGERSHSAAARIVLTMAPALYDPEPAIFVERQTGYALGHPEAALPVAFTAADGTVTKVLTDIASLPLIGDRYTVDASYLARVAEKHHDTAGMFYLTPPQGAIQER